MSGIVERLEAEVVPCPGKGLDGNGMQHCAECCFGSGVRATTDAELRIMLLARDAALTITTLTADLAAERALANQLAEWLLRIVPDQDRDLNDALTEWEARRER